MMNTAVAKMLGNLGHVQTALADELLGFFYFKGDPVVHRAGAGGFFKNAAQISTADGKMLT